MSDVLNHWHRQKAKRFAQAPAEYACAVTRYRQPSHGWKVALAIAAVLVLTAWRIA
jgi:hypothetical protein